MKKRQHHKIDTKTYEKGINSDTNKEILGLSNGEHVDALNMRSLSQDGDNSSKKKIKGEVLFYPNIDNRCIGGTGLPLSNDYICMLTMDVMNHIVEVHASNTPEKNAPLIRVNGKIVLMSHDFPVDVEHPLQYHKNEVAVGCELYITNNNTPPMVFSLKDLMNRSGIPFDIEDEDEVLICDRTYFDEFNINEYTVNIPSSLTKIQFIQQDPSQSLFPYNLIIGTVGVPVGYHSYSYRFVSQSGDRGRWSPPTEQIPVLSQAAGNDPIFPLHRHFSKSPNVTTTSIYGNHLKIRINNNNNFEAIEIRRDSWSAGSGMGTPPVSSIISIMDITPFGEGVYVLNLLDRASNDESEEILNLEDTNEQTLTSIQSCKSLRYFNDKLHLMNIKYASKDIDNQVEFDEDVTAKCFPTIQKIGKGGHKDVYNATYYKSDMRGDVVGIGIFIWDKDGNLSYVKKIPGAEAIQLPNRRDPVSIDTEGTSYKGLSYGGLVNGQINSNHEVFSHTNAVSKSSGSLEVNIANPDVPSFQRPFGYHPNSDWDYKPLRPFGQTDNSTHYPFNPNPTVFTTQAPITNYNLKFHPMIGWSNLGNDTPYEPKCFGLEYFSMGIGVKGISKLPEWAAGFSIVRTPSAKKVVAQGLGWWSMQSGQSTSLNPIPNSGWSNVGSSKRTDELHVYFPDFDPDLGGISSAVANEFMNHFSNFRIQLVAPLGFFTECYSFFRCNDDSLTVSTVGGIPLYPNISLRHSIAADLISYCRVIHDNGEINPGGCEGFSKAGIKYVGYGSNRTNHPPSVFSGNSQGNTLFSLVNPPLEKVTGSGRQKFFVLKLDRPIYTAETPGNDKDSDSSGVKRFNEPMYAVNLIRQNATVLDGNVTQFQYSGNYTSIESLISKGTGENLDIPLVSERWEDCCQTLSTHTSYSNYYSNLERFIWVSDPILNTKRRWLNITNKTNSQVTDIMNNLENNGFHEITDPSGTYTIYGVYRSYVNPINTHEEVRIKFEEVAGFSPMFSVPDKDSLIYVMYDNRIPVRVFGGDTWINENVWAPIDNEYHKKNPPEPKSFENKFIWDIPTPLNGYNFSKKYVIMRNAGNNLNDHLGQEGRCFSFRTSDHPAWIRQWLAMWTAETRTNLSFSYGDPNDLSSPNISYPLKNYTPRPYEWKDNKFSTEDPGEIASNNNLHGQYFDNYGREWLYWQYGGFRFKPQTNVDYSKKNTTLNLFSTPKIGFKEKIKYPTRVIWSLSRPINAQFTPTVRTFPPVNYYDLSDGTGEIKFGWDGNSGSKGNNLYALTSRGVALLMADKRMVSEINASELAVVGSDVKGILGHVFIDKSIGMADETWRSWAEYSNALFWHNKDGVFMLANDQISNLTDNGWFEMYRFRIEPNIYPKYRTKLAGVYNPVNKEYWMQLDHSFVKPDERNITPLMTIYGVEQESLQCRATYDFDKYLSVRNKMYGFRNMETYEIGVGNIIGGKKIESYLVGVSDKNIAIDKEFIRIRVNSTYKPDRVEFYSSYEDYISQNPSSIVDAISNPISIRDYNGFECYIPRKTVDSLRQQGRLVIFKIVNNHDENFLISNTEVMYKDLK